ncbi:amidohydrolase [Roseateles koreensis]|uniref:Amidohydrolase n=1 Tax=Roseateles koreensis TaxID=2987526 RepID=A0ABT5KSL7_9BURK|nr:amidohydrolase [Roseateles koreensis]MDC8785333.1 amidohydrolase [Roseateles koreensis]
MKALFSLVAAASALTCSASHAGATAAMADTIYLGGDIVTINELQPEAQAVAVSKGRIVKVGFQDEVLKLKGPKTAIVDLKGQTMLPGFIDGHGHIYNVGFQAASANLLPAPDGDVNDIPRLLKTLREAKANPVTDKLGFIIGFGYDDSQLAEQRHPTRDELDQVSKDVPVFVIHQSGHLGAVNSKALALFNINKDSKNPPGGTIRHREGSTEPNGVLEENAMFGPLFKLMVKLGDGENQAMVKAGQDLYLKFGYTTAQEGRATAGALKTFVQSANKGDLKIDVVSYADMATSEADMNSPWVSRQYKNHYRIGGVKLVLDGSPQGKTAWLTQPYFKVPDGQPASYAGYPTFKEDATLDAMVERAFSKGWQVLAHVNGDASIDQYIGAVRKAEAKFGLSDRRAVAIHAQTARLDQVQAFHDLAIMPSFFPMHTFYWGDWHRDSVLGNERAQNISPTGWALERGMIFTSHHDAPVALPNSLRVLSATVNRTTRTGKVLGPDQRVSPLTGLKALTLWAAYQYFEEKDKGSIEVGKLADFTLLNKNPLKVPRETLADLIVTGAIKEGKQVYTLPSATQASAEPRKGCADSDACLASLARSLTLAGLVHGHADEDEATGEGAAH